MTTFLILGGYGNTGLALARLLLQETGVHLVLAGRSLDKAEAAAAALNIGAGVDRVSARFADAADPESLHQAFTGMDLVIVAASTARYVKEVAGAALQASADYLDILYSPKKAPALQTLAGEIAQAGRCFITEAGFHPGLPAALVRLAAPHFDHLKKAIVASVINQEGGMPLSGSLYELVEEFKTFKAVVFKGGRWQQTGMFSVRDFQEVDFGGEFGYRYCVPLTLPEMLNLPGLLPGLRETGFYVAGFNWFTDYIVTPMTPLALFLCPRLGVRVMGRLFHWGLKTFAAPPYGTVLKIEAAGEMDGKKKKLAWSLFHPDAYLFTAIPVVACLLQYLDGSIRQPGLGMMGHLVDPKRLLADMARMGVQVEGAGVRG